MPMDGSKLIKIQEGGIWPQTKHLGHTIQTSEVQVYIKMLPFKRANLLSSRTVRHHVLQINSFQQLSHTNHTLSRWINRSTCSGFISYSNYGILHGSTSPINSTTNARNLTHSRSRFIEKRGHKLNMGACPYSQKHEPHIQQNRSVLTEAWNTEATN